MTKFSTLLLCIFLALANVVDVKINYIGEISCDTDVRQYKCVPPTECRGTCKSPCNSHPGIYPEIWGSGVYTYESPICRSALHDTRIPYYGTRYRHNVSFVRRITDPAKYLASIQHGITSTAYRSLKKPYKGVYTFTSSYLKENVLDVSTLNFMNLYPKNGVFKQECYITETETHHELDFRFYIPPSVNPIQLRDFEVQEKIPNQKGVENLAGGKEASWNGTHLQPGGYWCHITNNTYSHVMSLTMASDADFIPEQWTLTASINDNVKIKFTTRQHVPGTTKTRWRKDQLELLSFPNMKLSKDETGGYWLEINDVEIGDGGIYSLEIRGRREKQGIMRLIVRRCPKGNFGPNCHQQCTDCMNGGVCHDVMGICICAPGFTGKKCKEECMAEHFGRSCSRSCARSMHAIFESCKNALICLPDPYGCSCAPGYTGIACDKKLILDASTLSFTSLYPTRGIFHQECYIDDKRLCQYLDFRFYIPEARAHRKGVANSAGGQEASWSGKQLQPGGYWCQIKSNAFSHVMSMAMASDADFLPEQWTLTVNIHESVLLQFTRRKHLTGKMKTKWMKDQLGIAPFSNMKETMDNSGYYLHIEDVKIVDGGIYSFGIIGKPETQGIMRLIVRGCPKGYFGPRCRHPCPNCENGGICHEVMGTCICAPGFNGPYCENECTPGYFGKYCGHRCAGSTHTKYGSCKGALICLPDPYGCSCATGFTGLACDKCSESGTCFQQSSKPSHCDGNQAYNAKNGACAKGCAEGWKAVGCDISYPYLFRPPTLLSPQPDRIEILFTSWDKSQLGDGDPKFYIFEAKDLSSRCNEWKWVNAMYVSSASQRELNGVIDGLKPGRRYAIRVVIQDYDGHVQRELAPIAVYNTSEYFGEVTCDTDARVHGCTFGKICTVTCTSPCSHSGSNYLIWGTGVTQFDSRLCRTAVHNYRLASFISSPTNVTFVRSYGDLRKYLPSIQRRIVSSVFHSTHRPGIGIYHFASPYITETILDVATLNYKFLLANKEHFIQTCFTFGLTRPVNFQFYIPMVWSEIGVTIKPGVHRNTWIGTKVQPGGYLCNIINNTYSDIMSLTMAADADFLPEKWTVTTSIMEDVVIQFTPRKKHKDPIPTLWKKDQENLYWFPNMKNHTPYTLKIHDVQLGDAGIYSLEIPGKEKTQGIIRLIVRKCRKGYFGPTCNQQCPKCQNSGVCHDVMGICICSPGYHGDTCERLCHADTFSWNCSQSCASPENQDVVDNSCKSALICLPDPFGCACAVGYTGLGCDKLTIGGKADRTFKEIVESKQFNPYPIPTTTMMIGLKHATLSEGKLLALKNLRRTGFSTLTQMGEDSIIELRFGALELRIEGILSIVGPFTNITIRADIGFVDMLARILIPKKGGTSKLLDFSILKIKNIEVWQKGGTPFQSDALNMLLIIMKKVYPSIFQSVVESVFPVFAESFARKMNF